MSDGNPRIFYSPAFREAYDEAKREQAAFRSMLETYRSPRSIAAARKAALEADVPDPAPSDTA